MPLSVERQARLRSSSLARRAVRDEERRRRAIGLVLTAIVAGMAHVALLFPLLAYWLGREPSAAERTSVRMVSVSPSAFRSNRQLRLERDDGEQRALEEVRRREREREEELEEPVGQIVSLPRSNDEPPEHADYSAQDDHRAERETRSRYQTQHYKNPTLKPQLGRDEPEEQPSDTESRALVARTADVPPGGPAGDGNALEGTAGDDRESGAGAPRLALEIPRQAAADKLALKESDLGELANRERREALETHSDRFELSFGMQKSEQPLAGDGLGRTGAQGRRGGAGTSGLPSLAELTPSLVELERISGMPANDALDDVETDAETRLNAWRWKHAVFFDRLKKGVNRHWRGVEVYTRHDPTRELYGTKSLLTWLSVTIDRDGNVTDIDVLEQSGADFLDDEAIRTMRAAAPFVNPPTALFGGRETFTFRFGFEIRNEWNQIDLDWRPY